jgi:hypothetical protein
MGQIVPSVTFSGTLTTKQCYSAHFVVQPRNGKRRFVRHIDTANPTIGNGILAAGINGLAADDARVTTGNLAKILFSNLAAESWLGIRRQ